ncbi:hypothetical protein GCM10022393_14720 [Aquimarina addita]|uniref:VIT domain-containing protein n=2 Tax=Aquimarina addita TaxID=870485 RepID=A0ABP7XFJ8_9FLAO
MGMVAAEMSEEASDDYEEITEPQKSSEDGKNRSKTWKRSNKIVNTATLFVGDNEQLALKGSQIAIKVDGIRARVLIDCFFYNDNDQQLEGTFKMRLPQGASPYYFAFGESILLDGDKRKDSIPFIDQEALVFSEEKIREMRSNSWSVPKVARVVEKEKAAFAYGQTVRRRVDPALAEWAGADVYNCKVYPLMPNKLHRIVIGYDVNLTAIDDDWVYNFSIPKVDCPLVLDVEVAKIKEVSFKITPDIKMQSEKSTETFRMVNPKEEEIEIRYQDSKNIALQSPKIEGQPSYFASSITPVLPPSSKVEISDNAIIALDVSLSSNPDKFNVWLQLTEAILVNNPNTIKKFTVMLFNIETFWWKKELVENTPENVKAFLEYAHQIALEGASDINFALSTISNAEWTKNTSNTIFLMSDGADTWGESDAYKMAGHLTNNERVFAYNTGMSGTSLSTLNHLTRSSGGALFSVTGEDEIQKVSTAFATVPWRIDQISIPDTQDILIAGRPDYIYEGQRLLITGRGTISKGTKVHLEVSQNNSMKEIEMEINTSIDSELTSRVYGQIATGILEEFDYVTEKKSIAYAKHFKIPGKTCSLLMLDTEEDYNAYNIRATEDAYVVASTTVQETLLVVLKDIKELLGSSKNTFKQWIEHLANTDGMDFTIPASLEILVDKTPEANFSIIQKELECASIYKKEIPTQFSDSLLQPKLNYDVVSEEANRRLEKYGASDALKVISSLVEKNPGNTVLARDVGFTALDWGLNEQAYYLFKRVLTTRPYEPQTYQAIAKSLANIENYELSLLYYEIAITAKWDPRFGEFRRIVALEYLNLLGQIKDRANFALATYATSRYKTLRSEFKEEYADLMLVISWNTDNTDIDLHVVEPTGEECYYQNNTTKIGGYMTADVTQGYGPEMYILQDAKKGEYEVKVKYFASNRNRTSTRTKVYATIYKNWGKKNESARTKVITLEDNKEMHNILTVVID